MLSQRHLNKKLPSEPVAAGERRSSDAESLRSAAILSAQVVTLGRGNFARAARFRHGSKRSTSRQPSGDGGGDERLLEWGTGVVPTCHTKLLNEQWTAPVSRSTKTSAPSIVTKTVVQATPSSPPPTKTHASSHTRPPSHVSTGSFEEFRSFLSYLSQDASREPDTIESPVPTSSNDASRKSLSAEARKILGPAIPLRKSVPWSLSAQPVSAQTPTSDAHYPQASSTATAKARVRTLNDFTWPASRADVAVSAHHTDTAQSPKSFGNKRSTVSATRGMDEQMEMQAASRHVKTHSGVSAYSSNDDWNHLDGDDGGIDPLFDVYSTRTGDSERSNSTANTSTDTHHDSYADKKAVIDLEQRRTRQMSEPGTSRTHSGVRTPLPDIHENALLPARTKPVPAPRRAAGSLPDVFSHPQRLQSTASTETPIIPVTLRKAKPSALTLNTSFVHSSAVAASTSASRCEAQDSPLRSSRRSLPSPKSRAPPPCAPPPSEPLPPVPPTPSLIISSTANGVWSGPVDSVPGLAPRRSEDISSRTRTELHPLTASRARTASAPFIKQARKKSDAVTSSARALPSQQPSSTTSDKGVITPAQVDDFFDSIQAALASRSELPLDKLQSMHTTAPTRIPPAGQAGSGEEANVFAQSAIGRYSPETHKDVTTAATHSHSSSILDPVLLAPMLADSKADELASSTPASNHTPTQGCSHSSAVGSVHERAGTAQLAAANCRTPGAFGEIAHAFRQLQSEKLVLEQIVREKTPLTAVGPNHEGLGWHLTAINARVDQKQAEVRHLLGLLEKQKQVMDQLLATHSLETQTYLDEIAALTANIDDAERVIVQQQSTIHQLTRAQDGSTATGPCIVLSRDPSDDQTALHKQIGESAPIDVLSRCQTSPAGEATLVAQVESLKTQLLDQKAREAQIRTAYKHVRDELRKHVTAHKRPSAVVPVAEFTDATTASAGTLESASAAAVAHPATFGSIDAGAESDSGEMVGKLKRLSLPLVAATRPTASAPVTAPLAYRSSTHTSPKPAICTSTA